MQEQIVKTHNKASLSSKNRIFSKLFNKNHKCRVLDLHGALGMRGMKAKGQ